MRSRIRVEMFSRRSPGIIVVKLEGIHLSHYACIIGISFLVHRLKRRMRNACRRRKRGSAPHLVTAPTGWMLSYPHRRVRIVSIPTNQRFSFAIHARQPKFVVGLFPLASPTTAKTSAPPPPIPRVIRGGQLLRLTLSSWHSTYTSGIRQNTPLPLPLSPRLQLNLCISKPPHDACFTPALAVTPESPYDERKVDETEK